MSVVAAILALSVSFAACGDDSDEESTAASSTTAATTAEEGGGFLAENKAQVEKYLSAKGTFTEPPAESPKPATGKHVALVSCGSTVIPSCGYEIEGAKEAAESLGWKTTIIDAKGGDPTTTVPGISNAIAKKVDGIFTYYIECKYILEPLKEAKKAGIPVVNSNGRDCNESDSSAEPMFAHTVGYTSGTFSDWVNEMLLAQTQYAIDKKEGKAKVGLVLDSTSDSAESVIDHVQSGVDKCEECSLDVLKFPISDIGTNLQGKAESFLLKNQDVDSVVPAYSAILTGGLEAAVQGSGREILLSVAEGLPEGLELIRDGKAHYGAGISYAWEGYAAVDALNRIFNDEEPAESSGIGVKLFDKDHDMPTGEIWEPPYDYKALYQKAWGVSG